MANKLNILITGASGYIGGRLLKEFDTEAVNIISMVRRPDQFKETVSFDHNIRYGDTTKPESLDKALENVDVAYYLIHSLAIDKNFSNVEIESAKNFVKSAEKNNVKKIIYLGGLFNTHRPSSAHLESRKAVGDIIRASSIPSITFRASIILGSGSLSFELIRNLTERLPLMITPKWVRVKAQPIGIRDVLAYLKAAMRMEIKENEIFEIGGQDQVSYSDIMREYAKQRGLKRIIIPVPVLSPNISSLWLSIFTPIYSKIGRKLINSIKVPTIVTNSAKTLDAFKINPMGMSRAIKLAIDRENQEFRQTHWASSYSSSNHHDEWLESREGNKLIYTKKIIINAPLEDSFKPIQEIGGKNGWYFGNWLWQLRGLIDVFFGGPGCKRGRKHPQDVNEGDFLDWWRVEQYDPPKLIRLVAEMKLPGQAWLEFELKNNSEKETELYISAIYDPTGFIGRLYWYVLYPIHFYMFTGLTKVIKQKSEAFT